MLTERVPVSADMMPQSQTNSYSLIGTPLLVVQCEMQPIQILVEFLYSPCHSQCLPSAVSPFLRLVHIQVTKSSLCHLSANDDRGQCGGEVK